MAERLSATAGQVSLAWLLTKADVVPIPGTRRVAHLEVSWAANDLVLDEATIAELEGAFPPGTTVGARYPARSAASVPRLTFIGRPAAPRDGIGLRNAD